MPNIKTKTKKITNKETNHNSYKRPELMSGLLIVGIAIVGFIFALSAMRLLFEEPKYEDFCKDTYGYYDKAIPTNSCNKTPEYPMCKGMAFPNYDENGCVTSYTCSTCNLEYDAARENYSRNVFMTSIILGIIIIISSAFIIIPSIQNGLFITSIVLIIFGSSNYWQNLGKYLQFILMSLALASIMILAYKIYKRKQ